MSTLPAFSKDIRGQYYGGAFWDNDDFRVRIKEVQHVYRLMVEDSAGTLLADVVLDQSMVEGILRMASTDHDLSGYEDDWVLPTGMRRTLSWDLPVDDDHSVVLNEADIDEVAAWFRYATGEDEWTGGSVWEF